MIEAEDEGGDPIASVEVTYRPSDRWQMKLVEWRSWLVAPAAAVAAMLFVSLLFNVNAGRSVGEALRLLPYGLAGILGLCFMAVRVAFDLVPLVWEYFNGDATEDDPQGTFELRDDGLAIRSERMTATISWSLFESFRATPDRLFYFLSKESVFVLPRRCFADDEIYAHWREYSETKLLQNRAQR